jgi:hypothetical protein
VVLVLLLVMPYVMVGLLSLAFIFVPFVFVVALMTLWVLIQVFLATTPKDLIGVLGTIGLNALVYSLGLALAIAL